MMGGISDNEFSKAMIRHLQQIRNLEITFPEDFQLPGCSLVMLKKFEDARGFLVELNKECDVSLAMSYYSYTKPSEARDVDRWHLHKYQQDRFFILHGGCIFGLSDGKTTIRLALSALQPYMLYINPGIYHCFLAGATGVTLINFPTQIFNPADELRIPFSELEAPFPWFPAEF